MRSQSKWSLCGFLLLWYIVVLYLLHRTSVKKKGSSIHIPEMHVAMDSVHQLVDHQSKELDALDRQLRLIDSQIANDSFVLPVLVLTCNRPDYLEKTLLSIIKYSTPHYLPAGVKTKLIISQDCDKPQVTERINTYSHHISLWLKQPNQTKIEILEKNKKLEGYYWLSRNFRFSLNEVFERGHDFVVIIEDDLDISPDFFQYFIAGLTLLKRDPTLWCVSAWNDNGRAELIENDPELLHRTDFFPGLGWLLMKSIWMEIKDTWPPAYWDDWMRAPERRKGRACIRPEISRTSTFGKIGTSMGQHFDKVLQHIKHSDKFVPFTDLDLSYLVDKNYADNLRKKAYAAPLVSMEELDTLLNSSNSSLSYRLQYTTKLEFKKMAGKLGIMDDFKAGVPRTGYVGIVSAMRGGRRIYLTPPEGWKGYDVSWV